MKKQKKNNTNSRFNFCIVYYVVIGLCLIWFSYYMMTEKSPQQNIQATVQVEEKSSNTYIESITQTLNTVVRKEKGYTKQDVGASEQIFDKNGRLFYRNVMTDQYFTYLNDKDGYWLADETYVARHFGDTFLFGTRLFYRYNRNYYEQLPDSIIKISEEEFYKANYANPPYIGQSAQINTAIPHFEGPQQITYVSPLGEYGYETIGESYLTPKGNIIRKGD